MKTEYVSPKSIGQNPDNPRVIKDDRFLKLVRSIQEAPWMLELRPIVVNAAMTVLGGNMRLKACLEAKLNLVPIVRASELTVEQQREFIIKDNSGYGEWDFDDLQKNWNDLPLDDWGIDVPPVFVSPSEISEDNFTDSEISGDYGIIEGDVFEIGKHRLVCGDSRRVEHVDLCLGGESPYLMITDPPYGTKYNPEWRSRLSVTDNTDQLTGDNNADWSQVWARSPATVAYVYHGDKFCSIVADSLYACNYIIRNQIIWAKHSLVMSPEGYHSQHEPLFYAVRKGGTARWVGDRKQTTLWEIKRNIKNESGHPTQKPVECMTRPMANHEGDVYDPFCGSGTTMIAAEGMGRRCYAIEILPKYCATIIKRMRKLVPGITVLRNGETFETDSAVD